MDYESVSQCSLHFNQNYPTITSLMMITVIINNNYTKIKKPFVCEWVSNQMFINYKINQTTSYMDIFTNFTLVITKKCQPATNTFLLGEF